MVAGLFRYRTFLACAALLALPAGLNFGVRAERDAQSAGADAVDQAILSAFMWRSIGPDRGGRSIAVSGVKGHCSEPPFASIPFRRLRESCGQIHLRRDAEMLAQPVDPAHEPL